MLFSTFLQAGFECSTHKLRKGQRLDLVEGTRHSQFVAKDYSRLVELGIFTVREGVRWHLIESKPGVRDFSSIRPFLREALKQNIEIIWDLLHFGWPDHEDPFDKDWPARFAAFATDFARFIKQHGPSDVWIAPVNEISFLAWAAGDNAGLNPFARGRGPELKNQLVKAAVNAVRAIRLELPRARFVWPDPVIHITGDTPDVERYRLSMFEAWDMALGLQNKELGGSRDVADVIGINFYPRNQWRHNGKTIDRVQPDYRPFREMIAEVYNRYRKPILISETGSENSVRAGWLSYICDEVDAAMAAGIPVEGICWYPILNHEGWDDDRHCHNGLWDYADAMGNREIYIPLAREFKKRQLKRGAVCMMSENQLQVATPDLICFSHLRWEGVFQRPHHLMSRFANRQRVFFIEEPLFGAATAALVSKICEHSTVSVITPHLPEAMRSIATKVVAGLLEDFFASNQISHPAAWFYTPMALDWLPSSFRPSIVAYDCMDELALFCGAPAGFAEHEAALFAKADVVFTGGQALYEAKRSRHANIHAFPSAVDVQHFAIAHSLPDDQPDQVALPHPRIGFAGVIDERMDLNLVAALANLRPGYQFVFLGPVVKIDPNSLPHGPNLHWLGLKSYQDLPRYFAGWDVAMMPFALNDSTRYISPTKTPEYLSAGLPVISTPIRDVVNSYESLGLVRIAASAGEFASGIDEWLEPAPSDDWHRRAKSYVQGRSWNKTWEAMNALLKPTSYPSTLPTSAATDEAITAYV